MPKIVAIILGAGASHGTNVKPRPGDNPEYRPPLAGEIFKRSAQFEGILRKYPLAQMLSAEIARRTRRGEGLEEILRTYAEDVAKGVDNHITRQFLQVPLYLNSLFGEISQHFTKSPDEYANLVNTAFRHAEQIVFLTLNYDVLLEISLARIFGVNFSEVRHYIDERWVLAKLHGSVNWYRRLSGPRFTRTDDVAAYLEFLRKVNLPLPLQDQIYLTPMWTHSEYFLESIPTYPALTVPVAGKYELNCPPAPVDRASELLKECNNYLAIGTSGLDRDMLEFLNQHAGGGDLLVVGRDEDASLQTSARFRDAIPQFETTKTFHHKDGFSEFVDSGAMDEFFGALK